MKLRTSLLVSAVLLTTGTVGAMVAAEVVVLERAASRDVAAELARSRQVFEDLNAYRQSQFRAQSHVVADEPRLKAIAATEDVSRETVIEVSRDLRLLVQSDLFLITDADGRLLADALDPSAAGFDLSTNPTVSGAIAAGEKAGVWTDDRSAFHVHARALFFGRTRVGVVVVGFRFDDQVAETMSRQTGSAVVVELEGRPIALAFGEPGAVDRGALAAALAPVPTGPQEPVEITIAGVHYLAVAAPFSAYAGKARLRYVVLRSLDRALAPARSLKWALYGIAGAALGAARGEPLAQAHPAARRSGLVRRPRRRGRSRSARRGPRTGRGAGARAGDEPDGRRDRRVEGRDRRERAARAGDGDQREAADLDPSA
jgi:phosphoserine phosphatase RsbU/P